MGGKSQTQLESLVHSQRGLGDCPLNETLSQTPPYHPIQGPRIHLGSPERSRSSSEDETHQGALFYHTGPAPAATKTCSGIFSTRNPLQTWDLLTVSVTSCQEHRFFSRNKGTSTKSVPIQYKETAEKVSVQGHTDIAKQSSLLTALKCQFLVSHFHSRPQTDGCPDKNKAKGALLRFIHVFISIHQTHLPCKTGDRRGSEQLWTPEQEEEMGAAFRAPSPVWVGPCPLQ